MTNVITLNNCDSKPCDFHNKKNDECTKKVEESLLPSKEEQIPCFLDDKLKTLITRKKLRLVLDLDHTLVHSIYIKNLTEGDKSFLRHPDRKNWLKEGKLYMFKDKLILIKLRPYVRAFLKDASKMFDFSIFTLGTKEYAKRVVDILDPEGVYFTLSNVFSVEDCKIPKTKGLDVLHQDEKLALVVDDNKHVWEQNLRNLIEIKPYMFFAENGKSWTSWTQWRGDESEKYGELARVLKELRKIHAVFFDYSTEEEDDNVDYYKSRDVRDVVEEVRKKCISCLI